MLQAMLPNLILVAFLREEDRPRFDAAWTASGVPLSAIRYGNSVFVCRSKSQQLAEGLLEKEEKQSMYAALGPYR